MKISTLQKGFIVACILWGCICMFQLYSLSQITEDDDLVYKTMDNTIQVRKRIQESHPEEVRIKNVKQNLPPPIPTQMKKKNEIDCGCPNVCDEIALKKQNGRLKCKERIQFFMNKYNNTQEDACRAASQYIPFQDDPMLPCEIECHPDHCKTMTLKPKMEVEHLDLKDWKRYDDVVIVTKVLHPESHDLLKEMLCLLTAAYNRHVHYDIIVFTTIPWPKSLVESLQEFVKPAKLSVVLEGPPTLEEYLVDMTKEERQFLDTRCNVTEQDPLSWFHYCREKNSHLVNNLGYCWQSEFRAYHIWNHEALKPYKYMFWIDSDARATKPFEVDPMKVFIENDLNLMFDHYPGGLTRLPPMYFKQMDAYGTAICKITQKKDGSLEGELCIKEAQMPSLRQVYGFHHITRLDMYRNETHQKFLKSLVSDYKFSRQYDDQLAVTLPAVIHDGSKAKEHQSLGVHLGLHHNTMIDGKNRSHPYGFMGYWSTHLKYNWTVARGMCDNYIIR